MRPLRSPRSAPRPLLRWSALLALLLIAGTACSTVAGLAAAGDALQEAGYAVHDLLMEEGNSVYADLERPDGASDIDHVENAAVIIWDHLDDEAEQAEIRLRSPDDTDQIVTYSAAELQELHQERRS